MVEMNSHGLVQFFAIIKKAYGYLITQGKEFILWAWEKSREKTVNTASALKTVMTDYFIKSEDQLTKDQLKL